MKISTQYKRAAFHESTSAHGMTGCQIFVAVARPLTEDEERAIGYANATLHRKLVATSWALDPDAIALAAEQRRSLLACFPQLVYVREIPNGYAPDWPYPWYTVTTPIGHFKLGWRKRVIELDWSDTDQKLTADDLFPDVTDTKGGQMIHAWTYDKVAEYIRTIMGMTSNARVSGDSREVSGVQAPGPD